MTISEAFKKYNVIIYRFIFIRTGGSIMLAEDITQEVFLKALKKQHTFDDAKASMKTWLFVIAKNLVIDYYRKSKLKNIAMEDMQVKAPPENLDKELMHNYVLKNLLLIDGDARELIILRYIEEMDITEIAQISKKIPSNKDVHT